MERILAKIISYVLHPLFIPTYGYWILFRANIFLKHIIPEETKTLLLLVIFINTCVIPFLFILILSRVRMVQSIEIEDQKQRRIPFLLTAGMYFVCYWLLSKNNLPLLVQVFMLSACVLMLLTYGINWFWKISAHMIGIGGLCGSILALGIRFESDIQVFFMGSILLAGLTAFARLKLSSHTPAQVYVGFGLGFLTTLLMLSLLV